MALTDTARGLAVAPWPCVGKLAWPIRRLKEFQVRTLSRLPRDPVALHDVPAANRRLLPQSREAWRRRPASPCPAARRHRVMLRRTATATALATSPIIRPNPTSAETRASASRKMLNGSAPSASQSPRDASSLSEQLHRTDRERRKPQRAQQSGEHREDVLLGQAFR
jgi:hypothetical protein